MVSPSALHHFHNSIFLFCHPNASFLSMISHLFPYWLVATFNTPSCLLFFSPTFFPPVSLIPLLYVSDPLPVGSLFLSVLSLSPFVDDGVNISRSLWRHAGGKSCWVWKGTIKRNELICQRANVSFISCPVFYISSFDKLNYVWHFEETSFNKLMLDLFSVFDKGSHIVTRIRTGYN